MGTRWGKANHQEITTEKEMSEYKIESNVPMPEPLYWRSKYPLRQMKIGDSFFIPGKTLKERTRCTVAGAWFSKRNPEYKFTTRTVMESGIKGVRVWRVEKPQTGDKKGAE